VCGPGGPVGTEDGQREVREEKHGEAGDEEEEGMHEGINRKNVERKEEGRG
jgi:hypothetical protein